MGKLTSRTGGYTQCSSGWCFWGRLTYQAGVASAEVASVGVAGVASVGVAGVPWVGVAGVPSVGVVPTGGEVVPVPEVGTAVGVSLGIGGLTGVPGVGGGTGRFVVGGTEVGEPPGPVTIGVGMGVGSLPGPVTTGVGDGVGELPGPVTIGVGVGVVPSKGMSRLTQCSRRFR